MELSRSRKQIMPGTSETFIELLKFFLAGLAAFFGGSWLTNYRSARKMKKETESIDIEDRIKVSDYFIKQKEVLEKENIILAEKLKSWEEKDKLREAELLNLRKQLTLYKTLLS